MGQVVTTGSIKFKGEEIGNEKAFRIAHRGIGYVPENRDVFPRLTVEQNLILGEKGSNRKGRWSLADMYKMFPRLKEREHVAAGVLSGGEQQMLTLCRTLMGDPDLIMIDEPTEGLAPKIVELVADYLKELKNRGISVLLVEQKLAIALEISQRVYVMGTRADRVRGDAGGPQGEPGGAKGMAGSLTRRRRRSAGVEKNARSFYLL